MPLLGCGGGVELGDPGTPVVGVVAAGLAVPLGVATGACCDTPGEPTLLGLLGTAVAPGCVMAPAEPETPGVPRAPALLPMASPLTTISTRRFIWRPAAV